MAAILILSSGVLALIPTRVAAEMTTGGSVPFPTHRLICHRSEDSIRATAAISNVLFLPLAGLGLGLAPGCWILNETYGTVPVVSPSNDPPAQDHPDLNLAVRGYVSTVAHLGLVDYGGPVDANAPQLYSLFPDNRTAAINAVYRVYGWDWACNCRSTPIPDYEVTLAGMVVTPTETIRVPGAGADIGLAPLGYEAMVLYASANSITLKYTREDNVSSGYTLHVDNVCVEPRLLDLYQAWNAAKRTRLPALSPGQAFGRARGSELRVAIRDNGSFMDPRSRADWWQGR